MASTETTGTLRLKMIGQILIECGDITEEQLNKALTRQSKQIGKIAVGGGVPANIKRLGEILVEMDMTTEDKLQVALAKQKPCIASQAHTQIIPSGSTRKIPLIIYSLATVTFASMVFFMSISDIKLIFAPEWVKYPAHLVAYFVLFFLVYVSSTYSHWMGELGKNIRTSFLVVFAYSLFIELIQAFIPYRSFSLWDIVFNSLGMFFAALIVTHKSWGLAEVNYSPTAEIEEEVRLKHSESGKNFEEIPFKRAFDFTLSFIGLVFSLPIWILVTFLIWIEDPGPIFFIKSCVGKGGKSFKQIKFRSMIKGAESKTGPILALNTDPRFLRVGSIIRKSALDELPQLLNILKGDMSFVGPRPQRTILVYWYLNEVPSYFLRHMVKPGLTGIAQVFGHYYVTPGQKLRFDLIYLRKRGFWFDLKLFLYSLRISFVGGWQNSRGGFG